MLPLSFFRNAVYCASRGSWTHSEESTTCPRTAAVGLVSLWLTGQPVCRPFHQNPASLALFDSWPRTVMDSRAPDNLATAYELYCQSSTRGGTCCAPHTIIGKKEDQKDLKSNFVWVFFLVFFFFKVYLLESFQSAPRSWWSMWPRAIIRNSSH